ncbi:precorrin-6y C5,15-methyltransferase (decarboxylating) subunit CbiE [Arsenicicoccus piscis]|uniref:Tetrapyrrole methylase domain-containing protein n=1 Tax=Arsenicicoccus piscis TaxID=673954 RepID=A0ABQ6HN88_9MICO|nr:precorrin-6y C5,15-methyltransferase (decarboxylating) subunit CbiE [Arsenicicoccus piscis]GMA19914.1 hypothetical protein GCM10025862_19350 [Arsenicicoccus piscis]
MSTAPVTVVGIGVDGWEGLGPAARQAVAAAAVVMGSDRQRRLVAGHHHADEVDLPKPLRERLTAEVDEHADRGLVVLASGDPMHYGIGRTLVELLGAERVHVVPHASSMSLACARMGWPLEDVTIVSVVGRPLEALALAVRPGRRLLVLSADSGTPGEVAALLRRLGLGDSRLSVLDDLGGPGERRVDGVAATWSAKPGSELNIVAVDVRPDQEPPRLAVVPGLPDEVYDSDGQLTKRHVRAATLATLAPAPGELLWDVGAGPARSPSSGCGPTLPAPPSPSSRTWTGSRGSAATPAPSVSRACRSCRAPHRAPSSGCRRLTRSSSAADSPRSAWSTPSSRRCAPAGDSSPTL